MNKHLTTNECAEYCGVADHPLSSFHAPDAMAQEKYQKQCSNGFLLVVNAERFDL